MDLELELERLVWWEPRLRNEVELRKKKIQRIDQSTTCLMIREREREMGREIRWEEGQKSLLESNTIIGRAIKLQTTISHKDYFC